MADYTQILQQLGLSAKESAVYLALLSLGPSDVAAVAARAEVKRPTAYLLLDNLCGRGYAELESGPYRRYRAQDPRILLEAQKAQVAQLQAAVPGLLNLTGSGPGTLRHQMYVGAAGLRELYAGTLTEPGVSEILTIGQVVLTGTPELDLAAWYTPQRVAAGLPVRAILSEPFEGGLVIGRQAPGSMLHQGLMIYGDTVAAIAYNQAEPTGVTVTSRTMAQAQRMAFETAWSLARPA